MNSSSAIKKSIDPDDSYLEYRKKFEKIRAFYQPLLEKQQKNAKNMSCGDDSGINPVQE